MPDGAGPRYAFAPAVLSIQAACHYLGQMSATTFRAEVAIHIAPVRLTRGRIGWLREDLDRWLDSRRAPKDNPQAPEPAAHAARDPFAAALAALPPARRSRRQAPPA
jgi:predicted DNA-binding transcriptional regulator AlpA